MIFLDKFYCAGKTFYNTILPETVMLWFALCFFDECVCCYLILVGDVSGVWCGMLPQRFLRRVVPVWGCENC